MNYDALRQPEFLEYGGNAYERNHDLEKKTKCPPNKIFTKSYSDGRITALLLVVRTNRDYSISKDGVEGLASLEKIYRAGKGRMWPVCQAKIVLADCYSFGFELIGVTTCEAFLKKKNIEWRPPTKPRYGEWCFVNSDFDVVGEYRKEENS